MRWDTVPTDPLALAVLGVVCLSVSSTPLRMALADGNHHRIESGVDIEWRYRDTYVMFRAVLPVVALSFDLDHAVSKVRTAKEGM